VAILKKARLSMLQSFFGWPAFTLSLVLTVVGVFRRSAVWILGAMILALPGLWYLLGTPRVSRLALLPLLAQLVLIVLVLKQRRAAGRRNPAP
jgi:hypothetical protein